MVGMVKRRLRAAAMLAGLLAGAGPASAQGVPPYDTGLLDHPAPAAAVPSPAAPAPAPAPAPTPAPPEAAIPPQPVVPPHPDTVAGILGAARQLAGGGQADAASELVEEAETRLLDRSVEVGTSGQPIETPLVSALADARHALDAGQAAEGARRLDDAIAHLPPIAPPQ